jgi:glycosyltransferase involved in cell wall biosynthesis
MIWPLIRKQMPEGILRIYGAYPSQKVLQLHKPAEGLHIMGRSNDAQEVVRDARVVLAPLRFGAGIKGKLVEAMQCGTPSVTTTIGAESMCGDLPWNGFVVDELQSFADKAVELHKNENLWLKAQENGFRIIEKRYLKSLFADDFMQHILKIQTHLKQHRLHNFMGTMLQHHTLTSTKYMSRWIEEKNK